MSKMEAQPFLSDMAEAVPHTFCFAHQEGCRKEIGLTPLRHPAQGAPEAALPRGETQQPWGGERDPCHEVTGKLSA